MMLNITVDIYKDKSVNKSFFNLIVENLDVDSIKSAILKKLKIDSATILKDGLTPENIKRDVRYWVEIEK